MTVLKCIAVLALASGAVAYTTGEFVPKSYYIIDENGHQSDVVYFRSKRAVELFPLLRLKRGGGGAGSSSSASASSSSHSSSGSGGGGQGYLGGNDYNPGFQDPGFSNFGNLGGGGGGNGGGQAQSFASASSSSSSGTPGQGQGHGGVGNTGYQGPILFSRFGEDTGTGVKVAGSAQGEKGAFSSSSSAVDGNGKVKYSVQSGKY